ncbi:MAG: WYL domain-containing protein [Myxococcales bacterium]|nr:WYL domain-containing protein [Myxococcales bacterium]
MPRSGPDVDTLHRLWSLLRHVPRSPRRTDTVTLKRRLEEEGITVTARSVQRDLERIGTKFLTLRCDRRTKPYQWAWDGDAPLVEIPGMGVPAAVTFELVRAHLSQAMPRSTVASLEPHFARAREVLSAHTSTRIARWLDKVRVIPRGFPLVPPDVPPRVLDVVYAALLEDRKFRGWYRKQGAKAEKEYVVSPLALAARNGVLSLVCTFWDYDDVSHMLLHRMLRAEPMEEPVHRPNGFDLDSHLIKGGLGFARGEPLRLRALVHHDVAGFLQETPIAKDQKLSAHDAEHQLVQATVPNTMELRGWLLSYGPLFEVLEPAELRQELTATVAAMGRTYRKKVGKKAGSTRRR